MKAQDLMVGDWIIINGEAMKVMPTLIDALFYDNPIKVEPIEIDEAILLANGFENYKNIGSLRYYKNTKESLKFELYGGTLEDYTGNRICEIGFVHELQHALRLMGLTDLADNFKIA